jgi:hypothetical protein
MGRPSNLAKTYTSTLVTGSLVGSPVSMAAMQLAKIATRAG